LQNLITSLPNPNYVDCYCRWPTTCCCGVFVVPTNRT